MSYKSLLLLIIAFLLPIEAYSNNDIKINLQQNNSKTEIKIFGKENLKSAVFVRDNRIWFITDKLYDVSFSGLNSRYTTLTRFDKIKDSKTIFYFELDHPEQYEISMIKNDYEITIKITQYDPSIAHEELSSVRNIVRHINDKNNEVDIQSYEEKPSIIKFRDPFIGDELFIIPEEEIDRNNSYSFVDFKLLPSLSGIVIRNLSDTIIIKSSLYSINISSKTYLNISNPTRADNIKNKIISEIFNTSAYSILDIREYQVEPVLFNSTLDKIYQSINSVYNNDLKSYKFITLALFFMANNWYLESKSVFELIHNSSDILNKIYQLKLITGANYLMCGDSIDAHNIIESINIDNVHLKDKSEVRFWQNLSKITYKIDTKNAFDQEVVDLLLRRIIKSCIGYKSNFLSSYPTNFLQKIFFKILSLAKDINKPSEMKLMTDMMKKISGQDKTAQEYLRYYSGEGLLGIGHDLEAIKEFAKCAKSKDIYLYTHCKFGLLKTLFKNNQINVTEYINGLQSISTAWRGDGFEIEVLKELAQTYIDINDHFNAIRVLRNIALNNAGSYNGFTAYTKAGKIFVDAIQNKLTSMSNLDKLSFFYEFKDLIPLGETGDNITMEAASYMTELGLTEQAAKVIEYQIRNRLLGITREKAINELAKIYIDSKNFVMAEKVIIDWTAIPFNNINPFISERKYLYSEALIGNNQYQDAIALLYGDNSIEADQLRIKAYFNLQDWDNFNDNSEPYLYKLRFAKNVYLTDKNYISLLKQNIAYFNNNQINLLDDLYLDMKSKFKKSQKNAEKNKIFYNIANELRSNDARLSRRNQKEIISNLVAQVVNS